MNSFRLLWLISISLSLHFSAFAQNYNAGVGSGTRGSYNVHVGPYAGRVSTGDANSFVGAYAGYFNTTGSSNSFLGYSAGNLNRL